MGSTLSKEDKAIIQMWMLILIEHGIKLDTLLLQTMLKWSRDQCYQATSENAFSVSVWDELGKRLFDSSTHGDKGAMELLTTWCMLLETLKDFKKSKLPEMIRMPLHLSGEVSNNPVSVTPTAPPAPPSPLPAIPSTSAPPLEPVAPLSPPESGVPLTLPPPSPREKETKPLREKRSYSAKKGIFCDDSDKPFRPCVPINKDRPYKTPQELATSSLAKVKQAKDSKTKIDKPHLPSMPLPSESDSESDESKEETSKESVSCQIKLKKVQGSKAHCKYPQEWR
ncbi:hypothetical protein BTVI_01248 [Pitangus sulphuratus]|nr:hypothetical protein BTVI_01248 [Pitangus sulphuratus]